MAQRDDVWKLDHLSDAQLLESLRGVLRSQRQALAEIVAHLGEVEERRLHLQAAHGSMFAYCVARLGMSEDEACRRIELARLARKFPALFAELASGQITLSVALVLKPVLSPSNHLELLAAARGNCVRQARELVAERFPKPDAPSLIRKLPERRSMPALDPEGVGLTPPTPSLAAASASSSSAAESSAASPPAPTPSVLPVPTPSVPIPAMLEPSSERSGFVLSSPAVDWQAASSAPRNTPAPRSPLASRSSIEPLSAQRYRIQFTADAGLKQKIELARDLLRHAHPSGDFAPIVSRALDLLIDDLMRRHFGAGARRKGPSSAVTKPAQAPSPSPASGATAQRSASENAAHAPAAEATSSARSSTMVTSSVPAPRRSHISRAARRAIVERDGLGCSWIDDHGVRCGSQAWLEIDHRQPAGRGGSSEPDNLRLLCRAHNRLAAEQAYGRQHIERMSTRRQEVAHSRRPPA